MASKRPSNEVTRKLLQPWLKHVTVFALCLAAGFALTAYGPLAWDDIVSYDQSRWMLGVLHFIPGKPENLVPWMAYYGQLWELLLGIGSELIFPWLHDPYWVRHALNLTFYLASLYALFLTLRRVGSSRGTALLAVAGTFSIIRLGGHALFNTKDMPGAMSYLLCGIIGWLLLRRGQRRGFSVATLILIGIGAAVPFTVRTPLITYLPLFCLILLLSPITGAEKTVPKRLRMILVPIAACIAFIVTFSPMLWTLDTREWIAPFSLFSRFPHWNGTARAFGITWNSGHLPLWYPLIWIPVIITPFALAAALFGIVGNFFVREMPADAVVVGAGRLRISLTFRRWMWIVTLVSWAGTIFSRPILYDEERHLLFLMPILYLSCLSGLSILSERIKLMLAVLLTVTAAGSYLQWGPYAYVYKSPVIGDTASADFLGDYWGICATEAVREMKKTVPPRSIVKHLVPVADAMLERMQTSPLFHDSSYGSYILQLIRPEPLTPYYNLVNNREGGDDYVFKDIQKGNLKLIWQNFMPTGEPACTLVYDPNPLRVINP